MLSGPMAFLVSGEVILAFQRCAKGDNSVHVSVGKGGNFQI